MHNSTAKQPSHHELVQSPKGWPELVLATHHVNVFTKENRSGLSHVQFVAVRVDEIEYRRDRRKELVEDPILVGQRRLHLQNPQLINVAVLSLSWQNEKYVVSI